MHSILKEQRDLIYACSFQFDTAKFDIKFLAWNPFTQKIQGDPQKEVAICFFYGAPVLSIFIAWGLQLY